MQFDNCVHNFTEGMWINMKTDRNEERNEKEMCFELKLINEKLREFFSLFDLVSFGLRIHK